LRTKGGTMSNSLSAKSIRGLILEINKAKARAIKKRGPHVKEYWTVDRYKTCDDCKISLLNKTYDEMYDEIQGSV